MIISKYTVHIYRTKIFEYITILVDIKIVYATFRHSMTVLTLALEIDAQC